MRRAKIVKSLIKGDDSFWYSIRVECMICKKSFTKTNNDMSLCEKHYNDYQYQIKFTKQTKSSKKHMIAKLKKHHK